MSSKSVSLDFFGSNPYGIGIEPFNLPLRRTLCGEMEEMLPRSSTLSERSIGPRTSQDSEQLRHEIIRFCRSLYDKDGNVPSIAQLTSAFHINRTDFYRLFNGLTELCKLVGIPIPESRINRTEAASNIRSAMKLPHASSLPSVTIQLNEEQTRRILAISHLEGGIDPSAVTDRLLDTDTEMRQKYKLSFEDVRTANAIMRKSRKLGYTANSLFPLLVSAERTGLINLDPASANFVISALRELRIRGWIPDDIASSLSSLARLGFLQLRQDEAKYLIQWFQWAAEKLGDIGSLSEYLTHFSEIIEPFFEYTKGRISLPALLEQVREQ